MVNSECFFFLVILLISRLQLPVEEEYLATGMFHTFLLDENVSVNRGALVHGGLNDKSCGYRVSCKNERSCGLRYL